MGKDIVIRGRRIGLMTLGLLLIVIALSGALATNIMLNRVLEFGGFVPKWEDVPLAVYDYHSTNKVTSID